jgi:hypothetical protein
VIRKCAAGGATAAFLVLVFALLDLQFLVPYRDVIWHDYIGWICLSLGLIFVNVTFLSYTILRAFSMKTTGRKLEHMDRGLRTDGSVMQELSERLASE